MNAQPCPAAPDDTHWWLVDYDRLDRDDVLGVMDEPVKCFYCEARKARLGDWLD